ncbi:PDZ domain-containing protein [Georgenia deserti]|uniref:endopeptidase La n=1 Tax=Georgenia deserti TaxID=2093781 RepID=A0ABW4L4H9_9MICO
MHEQEPERGYAPPGPAAAGSGGSPRMGRGDASAQLRPDSPPGEPAFAGPQRPAEEWDRPERATPRSLTLVLAGGVLALALLLVMLVPVPYAVQSPGPTVDTLGEHEGEPLIEVDGERTYPSDGELRLTTVSVAGGPGHPVAAFDVVAGWLDPNRLVLPVEAVFPEDATEDELDEQSTQQMTSSQTNATVAALEELGHDVPMTLTVTGVAENSPSRGVIEGGDVVTAVRPEGGDRVHVEAYSDLADVLAETAPGTTVTVTVRRGGEDLALDVQTMASPQQDGSVLGVFLQPDVELPFQVEFDIEDIGGPSAGTMFALGIVDVLTPGDLTGGEHVAGTGTVDLAGRVGPIGGIQQKLVGARRDGADWFLAPAGNCDEVPGHVPDGLHVVRVATLAEARTSVEAIGEGNGRSLPTCG